MARKVWLVFLTIITVAFVATLLVIALREYQPSVWLTDREIDALVYQDMRELRLLEEGGKNYID